jgi:hypothetical protein
MKAWISRILIVFAIFTLGYGLGRDAALKRAASADAARPEAVTAAKENKVLIYYLHTTFRCVTCNTIERIARETVERLFADQLADGRVVWHAVNFQVDEALARRYEVAASAVVVVKIENGREIAYRRLDEAWTLHDKPEQLTALVEKTVADYLKELAL